MKILAMYLPQFHEIQENNEWWGKGFTEWTNIKRDNKFCNGLKPLDDNYYNLLDKSTVEWQTELARQHDIYGFCYYHYWFKGKKLLEKPAENLLAWKDIDQKYCFCWANHDWNRSWNGTREVLQKQEYGEEKDWAEHFEYLKDFFMDDRYIKVDNKPLFVVFNPNYENKDGIIEFFDKKCKEIGFDGIHYVESIHNADFLKYVSSKSSAIILREPSFALQKYQLNKSFFERAYDAVARRINNILKWKCFIKKYNSKKIIRYSLEIAHQFEYDKPFYLGAYSMWDNTYRHNQRGYKIQTPSEGSFIKYISELKKIAENKDIEYLFFNAWNEWAEGMILEPDNQNEYMFLNAIKKVMEDK